MSVLGKILTHCAKEFVAHSHRKRFNAMCDNPNAESSKHYAKLLLQEQLDKNKTERFQALMGLIGFLFFTCVVVYLFVFMPKDIPQKSAKNDTSSALVNKMIDSTNQNKSRR